MDFIPRVENPVHAEIEVPWYVDEDTVWKPVGISKWLQFPQQQGYNLDDVINGEFGRKGWKDVASFVQRWAYFGMIAEVLALGGYSVTIENAGLSGEEAGQFKATKWFHGGRGDSLHGYAKMKAFSTSLPDMILLWQNYEIGKEVSSRNVRLGKIMLIVKRVCDFVERIHSRENNGQKSPLATASSDDGADSSLCLRHSTAKHSHSAPQVFDDDYYEKNRNFFSDERGCRNDRLGSPGHALLLSIELAGELLGRAATATYGKEIELKWPSSLMVIRRLHLSGWCDFEIKKLADEGSMIRAYYLSSIYRGPTNRHDHCCTLGCVANQIHKVTYKTKHVREDCACEMVAFDQDENTEAAAWIRAGHTGVISRNMKFGVGLEPWRFLESQHSGARPRRYVAISHVWADGSGNAEKNALPSCQLDMFQEAANQLYESDSRPIPFWIDTVCVPSGGVLKRLAIRQMEKVYRDADKVLVFDSGLRRTSVNAAPSECITQIEICSWSQRLWTIQEAAFAKKLYFQFKDGIRSIEDLQRDYRESRFMRISSMLKLTEKGDSLQHALLRQLKPALTMENFLGKEASEIEQAGLALDAIFSASSHAVGGLLNVLRLPVEEEMSVRKKWEWLQTALPYRQTSIASDEGLCLGTLLGIDVLSLYDLPDERRVALMFRHIGLVNGGLIFGHRPRLQQARDRWMPSTFVNQQILVRGPEAQVTDLGLEVIYPGLCLTFPPGKHMSRDKVGVFGFLELDDEEGPGCLLAPRFGLHDRQNDERYAVELHLNVGSAGAMASGRSGSTIILEKPLVQGAENEKGTGVQGVLVSSIYVDGDHRHHVEYVTSLVIHEVLTWDEHFASACASMSPIGKDQKWLIS